MRALGKLDGRDGATPSSGKAGGIRASGTRLKTYLEANGLKWRAIHNHQP